MSTGRRSAICTLLAVATLAAVPDAAARPRPNVVMITTDDQTANSVDVMPRTTDLLAAHGTTFTQAIASFPLCAPSRATVLTARYMHNTGVRSNAGPGGGYVSLDHANTLPVRFQQQGYFTAHVGKYLNGYGLPRAREIPPGYDHWFALIDPTTYLMYEYSVNDQGVVRRFGSDASAYQSDVLAERAVSVIRDAARSGRPFFVHVAPLAPHLEVDFPGNVARVRPPRPAPRHIGFFGGVQIPLSPAFNEEDVTDKPVSIQSLPLLDANGVTAITASYRGRLETLLAVDELVDRVVDALDTSGVLDDTVIVFASDNGYLLGEHRVLEQKILHYGPSLRIPLVIRGPGFRRGARVGRLVSNVDLGATLARLTRAVSASKLDGRRLDRVARASACDPGTAVLLEGLPATLHPLDPRMSAVGVRTDRYRYTEYFTGERELYDLQEDPLELESRHAAADPTTERIRASLARLLETLRECAGRTCRPTTRLALRVIYGGRSARVRVAGADRAAVRSVEFVLDGRVGPAVSGPFRLRLPRAAAHGVWARVHLWDGRVVGLPAPGHACREAHEVAAG